MKREIITIDESLCNGCGACIPGCPEGALQIIDGKARLVSDLFCDGLGACIGHCPEGAITVETREAEAYDEKRVMKERIIPKGRSTVIAHLKHLTEHGADAYYQEAVEELKASEIDDVEKILKEVTGESSSADAPCEGGCPGLRLQMFDSAGDSHAAEETQSALTHWPIQMHLIQPGASVFKGADLLIAADCTAFTIGTFHRDLLSGKKAAIACPKLDTGLDEYREKITRLVDEARVNTITAAVMEVPCCSGLVQLVLQGVQQASRNVPVKMVQINVQGEIIKDEWI